jgi:aminomethyltransferase
MAAAPTRFDRIDALISRSGYTGEDGFEISVPAESADEVWQRLIAEPEVKPIGLGARDSLRLEAGLCLYGHDIDEATSPTEAGLAWSIGQRRRREGGFPGHMRILSELRNGPAKRRVGILPEGRAPAREGAEIQDAAGKPIGRVTSGGFGPSVNGPIAIGYVTAAHAKPDTPVSLVVRGEPRPARVVRLPFVPHRYHKP